MPHKITQAKLTCNQGTKPSDLKVTSQDFATIDSKAIATEKDKKANENIMPFGQCKLKPSSSGYLPCLPVPMIWQETAKLDEINGYKILLDTSTCQCSIGGKISIKDKGYSETHEIE